jgi:Leucine-rich repeat (LRR) protein
LTRLTDFGRAAALTEVELRNNPSLTSLTGLASVTMLETVTLEGNGLTSLAGLSGLERVDTLTVTGGGLVELGFPALESVGQLSLGSLPALTSLEGLNRVNVGTLRLNDLPALDSLHALAMTTGGVSVYIDACPALVSLDGLGRIDELGMLHLQGNAALSDVSVLTGLEDIEQVEILDNPVLRTADALALCSAYVHRDDWCTVSGNGP